MLGPLWAGLGVLEMKEAISGLRGKVCGEREACKLGWGAKGGMGYLDRCRRWQISLDLGPLSLVSQMCVIPPPTPSTCPHCCLPLSLPLFLSFSHTLSLSPLPLFHLLLLLHQGNSSSLSDLCPVDPPPGSLPNIPHDICSQRLSLTLPGLEAP